MSETASIKEAANSAAQVLRKYELTPEMDPNAGQPLYRIRALRDIPAYGVKAGDLGGFVESEANLSHEGDCWIADNAAVFEKARITANALVKDHARVSGRARIRGGAQVTECAAVCGDVEAFGACKIGCNSMLSGSVMVFDHAIVEGRAEISGSIRIHDWAHIGGTTKLTQDGVIIGIQSKVMSNADLRPSDGVRYMQLSA